MFSRREERAPAVDVLPDFALKQRRRGGAGTKLLDHEAPATLDTGADPEASCPQLPAQRAVPATERLAGGAVSAGLTLLDPPDHTTRSALHEADRALSEPRGLDDLIRSALDDGTFALHAQRVRSVRTDAEQWELVLALPDLNGQLLAPDEFLPIAEELGLGVQIDTWVTKHALACLYDTRLTSIEVNVGPSTLNDPSFISVLRSAIRRAGVHPRQLVFEVNASVASAHTHAVRGFFARLKALGCRVALDDFGANAGALDQLKKLPLDLVKIDGSFVRHVATDPDDLRFLAALTLLAQGLGCQVVAMDVADASTQRALAGIGVDFVQGSHVGRPLPLPVAV
jgi:EAL domain-containing protein (putative c-di-GMP-specific phosphodiesterase class I)